MCNIRFNCMWNNVPNINIEREREREVFDDTFDKGLKLNKNKERLM